MESGANVCRAFSLFPFLPGGLPFSLAQHDDDADDADDDADDAADDDADDDDDDDVAPSHIYEPMRLYDTSYAYSCLNNKICLYKKNTVYSRS